MYPLHPDLTNLLSEKIALYEENGIFCLVVCREVLCVFNGYHSINLDVG